MKNYGIIIERKKNIIGIIGGEIMAPIYANSIIILGIVFGLNVLIVLFNLFKRNFKFFKNEEGIIFYIFMVISISWASINFYNGIIIQAFTPYLNNYLNVKHQTVSSRPYIAGKIIPIDMNKKQIDTDVYFSLPKHFRAANPHEVTSVAALYYKKLLAGRYNRSGGNAYDYCCGVYLIDIKNKIMTLDDGVVNEAPKSKAGLGSASGSKPVKEFVQLITKIDEMQKIKYGKYIGDWIYRQETLEFYLHIYEIKNDKEIEFTLGCSSNIILEINGHIENDQIEFQAKDRIYGSCAGTLFFLEDKILIDFRKLNGMAFHSYDFDNSKDIILSKGKYNFIRYTEYKE